jgi:hypothetical protein
MNLRRRIYLAYVVGLSLLGASLVAALFVHQTFLIALFAFQLAFGTYVGTRRCPRCRKAVLNNPVSFLGTTFHIWTVRVPANCTQCGESLVDQRVEQRATK